MENCSKKGQCQLLLLCTLKEKYSSYAILSRKELTSTVHVRNAKVVKRVYCGKIIYTIQWFKTMSTNMLYTSGHDTLCVRGIFQVHKGNTHLSQHFQLHVSHSAQGQLYFVLKLKEQHEQPASMVTKQIAGPVDCTNAANDGLL